MFVSTRIAANAMLLAVSVGASAAMAQQPQPPANAPKPAARSADAVMPAEPSSASPMVYRSAFEGYKGLSEQPVQSWREFNDAVGRIGGWQSYAREGQGGPEAGSVAPPKTKGMAGMPGMSGMPADHGGMKMPPSGNASAPPIAPAASTPGQTKAPVKMPTKKAKMPAASASMPADHMGNMKP